MNRRGIQIGKAAEQAGLSVDAIRFYEKQRLLDPPPRTGGGFRLFSAADIERIRFIRGAQRLGFSLPEIRELIVLGREGVGTCAHVRDLLRAHLAAVRGRIRELGALERQLAGSLRQCERRLKSPGESHSGRCPVIEVFAERATNES